MNSVTQAQRWGWEENDRRQRQDSIPLPGTRRPRENTFNRLTLPMAELLHVLSTPLPSTLCLPGPQSPASSWGPSALSVPGAPVPCVSPGPKYPVPSLASSVLCLPRCPVPSTFLGPHHLVPSWGPLPAGEPHPALSLTVLLCGPCQLIVDGGRTLLRLISCF